MCQLSAGTLLLGVVAQPRAAPHGELHGAQREALVVVSLEAPLRRLERCPHLRNELQEEGQEGGLGPLLGGGAALRRDGIRLGLGDVFECPDGYQGLSLINSTLI